MAALALPAPAAADHAYGSSGAHAGHGRASSNDAGGIDTDSFDNVYVADYGNHRIQKFSPDGELMPEWGTYGTGTGQFLAPRTSRSTAPATCTSPTSAPTGSRSSTPAARHTWA